MAGSGGGECETGAVVEFLLSVTFGCGLVIAGAHVANRQFLTPIYDVVANLAAFISATAASALLHHWVSAGLSARAVACWLWLARRTTIAARQGKALIGHTPYGAEQPES